MNNARDFLNKLPYYVISRINIFGKDIDDKTPFTANQTVGVALISCSLIFLSILMITTGSIFWVSFMLFFNSIWFVYIASLFEVYHGNSEDIFIEVEKRQNLFMPMMITQFCLLIVFLIIIGCFFVASLSYVLSVIFTHVSPFFVGGFVAGFMLMSGIHLLRKDR